MKVVIPSGGLEYTSWVDRCGERGLAICSGPVWIEFEDEHDAEELALMILARLGRFPVASQVEVKEGKA